MSENILITFDLFILLRTGLLENAQLYLRNGALTNVTDKLGKTPLHYAAEKGTFM